MPEATLNPTIDLFTSIQPGTLALPNRIVLAPITHDRAGAGNGYTDYSFLGSR